MELQIGLASIESYKRLAYTPWHAIAEFVDNSTQSYFNNKQLLDSTFTKEQSMLNVFIVYDREQDILRISDNSIGMSLKELESALIVSNPPSITTGRSKYGMGMKTAACWFGNEWTVRTKKLGEMKEYSVTINVDRIASGNNELQPVVIEMDPETHGTTVEIRSLFRKLSGRTSGKIKKFLASMYRLDIQKGIMRLEWQGEPLVWNNLEERILRDRQGNQYKKNIRFDVEGKLVEGWVAIFGKGSRSDAGFSIIQHDRVIKGWPESWRPTSIFGQDQGSNDLINQRIFGEVHLNDFTVSHTKDSILWFGDEEDEVLKGLEQQLGEYKAIANVPIKNRGLQTGPSEAATRIAIQQLEDELSSPEMIDEITVEEIPSEEAINENVRSITEKVVHEHEVTFNVTIGAITVTGYIDGELSPNDPYVTIEATQPNSVLVIINASHPHWTNLDGSEVANYIRHCVYDAVAEWQARNKHSTINPNTINLLKDKLLRVKYLIEQNKVSDESLSDGI